MKTVGVVAAAWILSSMPAALRAEGVNDAQIASIVLTANQVDIEAGKLAAHRASRDAVRAFARLMVADHAAVNKSATDLAATLKVTPEDNPTSRSLAGGGRQNLAHLRSLSGEAFDKAYIDHEVAYHRQVIEALDATLIPHASHPDLKALLVKVRPAFVAHLDHAKQLQASTAGSR